jgi:hypothetical protein
MADRAGAKDVREITGGSHAHEHHHIITTVGYFALATASLVACIAR